MAELKLTNNPCKFCNGEIDEGKPLCGDFVDIGVVKIKFCPMCGRKFVKD